MQTSTAIILTQLPIAIAILLGVYELFRIRKEIGPLLEKIEMLLKKKK
jgi:hypothetical protein